MAGSAVRQTDHSRYVGVGRPILDVEPAPLRSVACRP
jgi:hypothetical protein